MSETLRTLRKLILGETWTLPAGVIAAIGICLIARAVLPRHTWEPAGGFVLFVLVAVALVVALAPAHRARRG
ncbi:MAG: hypothetical protein QOJ07_3973 [Thermoleophilaceae bacterium]|nr:hypothetical protein [Thermoleophilaceae bacterium]